MVKKIRFIEPCNPPYRRSIRNLYTHGKFLRSPGIGLITLATIVKQHVSDTLVYSELVAKIIWDDVLDADIVFLGIFTYNAPRGYEVARYIKENSSALVVIGGLHASLAPQEALQHCDYVLTGEGDESIIELIESINRDEIPQVPGVWHMKNGSPVSTGEPVTPTAFETIPDRSLVHRYQNMAGHNPIWAQVHASRGCPHDCDYCAIIVHLGRKIRTRTPESVIKDIEEAIDFHRGRFFPRINRMLWITDDNFFANRTWAISVLKAIIESDIKYSFTVQARYEVGFDDEMLDLLKRAGFFEISMGIEFLDNESFEQFNKRCTYDDVVRSIKNVQAHGLGIRGLFIVGADNHTQGVGQRIVDFVDEHGIHGLLLQSMYFTPSTPAYEANRNRLIHEDWEKHAGYVVHYPSCISPYDLQLEVIEALSTLYSVKRLIRALLFGDWHTKMMFFGEFFWHRSIVQDLKKELPFLKEVSIGYE